MSTTVHLIDDDESFLRSMTRRLGGHGYRVASYSSVAEFLLRPDPEDPGCVLTDLQMPRRDGFELQEILAASTNPLPVVFITGKGDIPTSVRAMRGGAEDFLTKRVQTSELISAIDRALARNKQERAARLQRATARQTIERLSARELQMLLGIVTGMQNKEMAEEYEMSERTVKYYRTMLTRRLDIYAAVDLVRLVQDAGISIKELKSMADAAPPGPQHEE